MPRTICKTHRHRWNFRPVDGHVRTARSNRAPEFQRLPIYCYLVRMYQSLERFRYFLVSSFSTQQPIISFPCFYGPAHARASYQATITIRPILNRNRYLSPDRKPSDDLALRSAVRDIEIARSSLVEPREQRARFVAVRPSSRSRESNDRYVAVRPSSLYPARVKH